MTTTLNPHQLAMVAKIEAMTGERITLFAKLNPPNSPPKFAAIQYHLNDMSQKFFSFGLIITNAEMDATKFYACRIPRNMITHSDEMLLNAAIYHVLGSSVGIQSDRALRKKITVTEVHPELSS